MLIGWKFYCIQIIYLLGCLVLFHEFAQSGSLFFRLARGLINQVRVGLYLYSKFRNQETANDKKFALSNHWHELTESTTM